MPCAVAANDVEGGTRAQLRKLGWLSEKKLNFDDSALGEQLVSVVRCSDSSGVIAAKPDASMLVSASDGLDVISGYDLKGNGADVRNPRFQFFMIEEARNRFAMIGDSAADLQAGLDAGFGKLILVGDEATVGQYAHLADVWVKDLDELLRPPHGIGRESDRVLAKGKVQVAASVTSRSPSVAEGSRSEDADCSTSTSAWMSMISSGEGKERRCGCW